MFERQAGNSGLHADTCNPEPVARTDHLFVDGISSFQQRAIRRYQLVHHLRTHLMLCNYTRRSSQVKVEHELLSVVDVARFIFEPAFMMDKCDLTGVSNHST